MSRHEGVSCDSCLKGNFRGRRYKCLICYDYDLCATCYEAGATSTRHTTEHPMQCILTRSDFDLYYGGEALTVEQPQSFTCPYCGKMGFTETALQEHVTSDHSETSFEVVCPVCAALPGGEPNLVTDDFAGHLTLEHRSGPRDLISFLDEPSGSRHGVRRIPHPTRGVGGPRARRTNMHFSSSGGLSSLSPSSRESVDPIAELLSQLSGVRRTAATSGSTPSQLQQLQMQLQLERTQAARQQLERLPRRQAQTASAGATASAPPHTSLPPDTSSGQHSSATSSSQLMLTRCLEASMTDVERETVERSRADRSLFVQELVLTTLSDVARSEQKMVCNTVARDYPRGTESVVPKRPQPRSRPQAPPPTLRPTPRHHPGTGTIREVVTAPPPPSYAGTARRKPVRPVQASEPPPSH
ncbi:E3 ubiquitin-protein ligase KCMF1-like isoform X2 [Macrosteles quadrilineatus]|uniref:E3 ubiquitin-protein ligase KCMF1-like isoform X2 n=1 Tax=Macrosteles quadrilineatus TaxID=74068 RepID=UPI0023E30C32|nr:E3 ubiquitin-protein ligase KCMF1-like isoform X2 [Macrosteles quadrilineatus]